MDIEKKILELKKMNNEHKIIITKLSHQLDNYNKYINSTSSEYNNLLIIYNNIIKMDQRYILKHQH